MSLGTRQNLTALLIIYKLKRNWAGIAFAFMGYILFMACAFEKAGQIEQSFGKEHLLLKEAVSRTFLIVLGCVIIVVTLERIKIRRQGDGVPNDVLAIAAYVDEIQAEHE